MAQQTGSMYCPRCRAQVAAVRTACNHLLHLFLSLLCVFWLPVWLLKALTPSPWRCTRCGSVSTARQLSHFAGRLLFIGCGALLALVAWACLAGDDPTAQGVGVGAGLLAGAFVLVGLVRRA